MAVAVSPKVPAKVEQPGPPLRGQRLMGSPDFCQVPQRFRPLEEIGRMAFKDPAKFDHDNDGHAGGSLAKGIEMGGKPVNVPVAETATDTVTADQLFGGEGADTLADTTGLPSDMDLSPVSELDPNDPAVTGIPRDERHDSIDPATGTLTDEAQELRRQRASEAE